MTHTKRKNLLNCGTCEGAFYLLLRRLGMCIGNYSTYSAVSSPPWQIDRERERQSVWGERERARERESARAHARGRESERERQKECVCA